MTVDFNDYFWGAKNTGFDVLYHNMKYGLAASKDLENFLREVAAIEENCYKFLLKLGKQASCMYKGGTYSPVWQILTRQAEKLANCHYDMVQKILNLAKEIGKYSDELHKKHKIVKEEESSTLEVVQTMQNVTSMTYKAKDLYLQKRGECDKLKKENNPNPKEIEKVEIKVKKAFDDFKSLVQKYNTVKEDFEEKMTKTCRHFQEVEEAHLAQMMVFTHSYLDIIKASNFSMNRVYEDAKKKCDDYTVDKLLEEFVKLKCTGADKPVLIDVATQDSSPILQDLEQPSTSTSKKEGNESDITGQAMPTHKSSRRTTSLLNLFMSNTPGSREGEAGPCSAPSSPTNPGEITRGIQRGSKWFLRSRRDKGKQKKSKKKKDNSDDQSNKEEKSDLEEKDEARQNEALPEAEGQEGNPQLDEDGYTIQPEITTTWTNEKSNFYSSSDSDSDDEAGKKFNVKINPLNNGSSQPMSASVDELRATVGNLHLAPASGGLGRRGSALDSQDAAMKRSQSVSQQLGGKPSSDLLGLNFQSPVASNASTPTNSHPYAPLQSPSQPTLSSPTLSGSKGYSDLGDLFSEVGDIQPPATSKTRQITTPTSGYMSIPRPPSRRSDAATRGHTSPSTVSRADSIGSLEFRTASTVGLSRGPSPLTIGMADTIPIAIAFHEIVHSFFRGADEKRCQVKMSGDMMLSFPAGIITVLANNPNPAQLSFRVLNTQRLFEVLPNKTLVTIDTSQAAQKDGSIVVEFNMTALSALLKKQSEQNPTASYFNVDILKYHITPEEGATSCPLQVVAYWKCYQSHTDLKIGYKYNSKALSSASPLFGVTVVVPINGRVKTYQSKPTAKWDSEVSQIIWKFAELSQCSENNGVGSLLARFELEEGPSTPAIISAYFSCEGATASGIGFQLLGSGYRISLIKRRLVGGKYICEGETTNSSSGTETPSSTASTSNC